MMKKRILAFVLALCLVLPYALTGEVSAIETENLAFDLLEDMFVDLTRVEDLAAADLALEQELVDENGNVEVFIVMEGQGVVEADPSAVPGADTQATVEKLEEAQDEIMAQIQETLLEGEDLDISYSYTWLFNGVAAQVPYKALDRIRAVDGVDQVIVVPCYQLFENQPSGGVSLHTLSDGVMIGREDTWANGYTGKGSKIAVIDTGLDVDHQNFQAMAGDKLTEDSATADSVAAVLGQLNASARYPGLTIDDVYYSNKVVFGFNYADDTLNVTHDHDGIGDHGTHVAGIAAANKVEGSDVVGVAPDAQILVMKVFGARRAGATSDIIAALEDALLLGVDVVNMSLGTNAGFTSSADAFVNAIYERVAKTNTVLSISAGNNYTAGYSNHWGTNANTTNNPDNAVIGEPGIYTNAMSVASVENVMIQRKYILVSDGYKMPFYETSSSYGLPLVETLTGEYPVVLIPGNGEAADYEGLDLSGKIALVQRGVISFGEKAQFAANAGATACIVYNNISGEFGMDLTDCTAGIPCVSITMEDGERIVKLLESGEVKLSFPQDLAAIPNANAWQMSDFSSWGLAPDLTLEPDITAPGGNIYSTIKDGEYGLMSGTSMAAPNIAGISALVMQYVKENFDGTTTDYRTMVQNLLVSTSVPLSPNGDGLYFSPRSQGSGLANAYYAIATHAYLTVEGSDTPKASLGDDPERTGLYDFTYKVTNFGAGNLYYSLDTLVQTEDCYEVEGYESVYFMSSTPRGLTALSLEQSDALVLTYDLDGDGDTDSHDAYILQLAVNGQREVAAEEFFRFDLDGDETLSPADVQDYLNALVGLDAKCDLEDKVLQVKSGETVEVDVSVELSAEDREYLDTCYPNGGYVEGFTMLTARSAGAVDLSLPYLAYYGSWDEPPILDDGEYWDMLNAEEGEVVGNQYFNTLFTNFYGYASYVYPGFNVYVEEEFDPAHIAVSPNRDGYFDTVDDIYTSLLRNAAELTYRYTNIATGEIYYEQAVSNVSKSVYSANYEQIIPNVYTWYDGEIPLWDWLKPDDTDLDNNTTLMLEVEVLGAYEGATPEIWSVPIYVDLEAPELLSVVKQENKITGKVTLEMQFRDNHFISAVGLMNSDGSEVYHLEGVEDPAASEDGYRYYTVSYDVTDVTGKVMILAGDYAMNQGYYAVNMGGEGASYGQLVGYQYNFHDDLYGWVSFDPEGVLVEEEEEPTDETAGETDATEQTETTAPTEPQYVVEQTQITMDGMNFVAAEYVNGFVYAQTEDGALYGFRYADMLKDTFDLELNYITTLEFVYQDFAYNYAEGQLYGLYVWEEDGYPYSTLNTINVHGAYHDDKIDKDFAPYEEYWAYQRGGIYGLGLAIDDAGTFYILCLNHNQKDRTELWVSYDSSYGTLFKSLMTIDVSTDYLQSMTWDHNTETLYWARFMGTGVFSYESDLYRIDVASKTYEKIGALAGETCALFAPLTGESAAKDAHRNVPVVDTSVIAKPVLRENVITMNVGAQITLLYDLDPWYSDHRDVIWASSDPSVATVDQDGNVTAVGVGEAVITVANKSDLSISTSCTIQVTALSLKLEGIITAQTAGVGGTGGVSQYVFEMNNGVSSMGTGNSISAPEELNYGLSLATSVYARGYIWACEYGNTGMIYKIDPNTFEVVDVLQPRDGDMLFGMTYNPQLDTFTAIMNMYLYVDLEMTHEEEEDMMNSVNPEGTEFTYHKLNLLPYLLDAHGGFITGETGQGASSEIVMCGVTTLAESYTYVDTNLDFLGVSTTYGANYTATQTLVVLDNVGRLWYIDEICGMRKSGNYYRNDNGDAIHAKRYGVMAMADENGTYSVFNIRAIEETELTDMFRNGNMPRITYHFSDIEYAGKTADGANMFALSLYDYWNNGTTNELYLCVAQRTSYDEATGVTTVLSEGRMYDLGDTGRYNIIASIHSATVTGGVDPEDGQ